MMKNFWRRANGGKSYIIIIVELTKEVEKIIPLRTRSRFKY